MGKSIYSYLEDPDFDAWDAEEHPLEQAISSFDAEEPEPLLRLLRSTDEIVARRGLFIFGELGKKAFGALDEALAHVSHTSVMARSSLVDGFLCYSRPLSANQMAIALALACDPEELIRGKFINFLGACDPDIVLSGINKISNEERRERFSVAFRSADVRPPMSDEEFSAMVIAGSLHSTFQLAAFERAARDGMICVAPNYDGDSFVGKGTSMNIGRLIKRAGRGAR